MKLTFSLLALLALILSPLAASTEITGADESVFADANIDVTLYVHDGSGSDNNDGSKSAPFKTLGKAISSAVHLINAEDKGVKVLVGPGTYCEQLRYFYVGRGKTGAQKLKEMGRDHMMYETIKECFIGGLDKDTLKPLVIEAFEPGTVIIDGTEEFLNWEREDGDTYTHKWEYNWGKFEDEVQNGDINEVGRRREMVFVDGQLLRQVSRKSAMEDYEGGTYYVDEKEDKLYVHKQDLRNSKVEVATWPRRTELWWGRMLNFEHSANIALKGLTFTRIATSATERVVNFYACDNVLVDNVTVTWTNSYGLEATRSENVTVRNCTFTNNGLNGFNSVGLYNFTMNDSDTSNNCWRIGEWGGWVNWLNAGTKIAQLHNARFDNLVSNGNYGCGFWLDTDIRYVEVLNCTFSNNMGGEKEGYGIFTEHTLGPILFENCEVNDNRLGFYNSATQEVTVRNCRFLRNKEGFLAAVMHQRNDLTDFRNPDMKPITWEKLPAKNMYIENCEISIESGHIIMRYKDWADMRALETLVETSKFRNNKYSAPESDVFEIIDGGRKSINFSKWKRVADDEGSTFERL